MATYNIVWGPCTPTQIVKSKRRNCNPPTQRPHPLTTDPEMFDPRPPFPCVQNPCCVCRPGNPPPPPKCFDLKLKLLQDCYNCQLSDKYRHRRKSFYDRWQVHLDNLRRYPDYDYKVYCCDDYFDQSINRDFVKYSRFHPDKAGKRERDRRNFIWPEVLFQTVEEQECARDATKPRDEYPCRAICDPRSKSYYAEAKLNLSYNEPYTIWHEKVLGLRRHVEGSTLVKSRIIPFHRDASFSTPLLELSTGNEIPFKQFRDVKVAM